MDVLEVLVGHFDRVVPVRVLLGQAAGAGGPEAVEFVFRERGGLFGDRGLDLAAAQCPVVLFDPALERRVPELAVGPGRVDGVFDRGLERVVQLRRFVVQEGSQVDLADQLDGEPDLVFGVDAGEALAGEDRDSSRPGSGWPAGTGRCRSRSGS